MGLFGGGRASEAARTVPFYKELAEINLRKGSVEGRAAVLRFLDELMTASTGQEAELRFAEVRVAVARLMSELAPEMDAVATELDGWNERVNEVF